VGRGPRIIRCKGIAVSIGPAVAATLGLLMQTSTGMLMGPASAHADNECGAAVAGGSVVCDPSTYTPSADGDIRYTNNGLTLRASDLTLAVQPTVNDRSAIRLNASDAAFTGDLSLQASGLDIRTGNASSPGLGSANTDGRFGDGLRVEQRGTGAVSLRAQDSTITTFGYNAVGVYGWQRNNNPANASDVEVFVDRLNITTHGNFSHGVFGRSDTGNGDVSVEVVDSRVDVLQGSNGVFASISGATASASLGEVSIRLRGENELLSINSQGGHAVVAQTSNLGAVSVLATGRVQASSYASERMAIGGLINNTSSQAGVQVVAQDGRFGFFTEGSGSHAVLAQHQGLGHARAQLGGDGSEVQTSGDNAHGIHARTTNPDSQATAEVVLTDGRVSTQGAESEGIYALHAGSGGAALATQLGGLITTQGEDADGIVAYANNPDAAGVVAVATQSGGRLETSGPATEVMGTPVNGSAGLVAQVDGSGSAWGVQSAGASIFTSGVLGLGMAVRTAGVGDARAVVAGSITTTGDLSAAVVVRAAEGQASVQVSAGAQISTSGEDAAGIVVLSTNGDLDVVQAGTIVASGDGIQAIGSGSATITNTGSVVSSAGHGIDASGVGGGAFIRNSGNITAMAPGRRAILGSAADDTLELSGGLVTGAIDLGDGDDTFAATGGQIRGSVYLGRGNDIAVLGGGFDPSGLVQLDGGEGNDVLTISGVNLTAYTNRGTRGVDLTGWEVMNVGPGAELKLSGDLYEAGPAGPRELNVARGGTLDLRGNSPGVFTLFAHLNNAGAVTFQDGQGDDLTTVAGNYQGRGGMVRLDTEFGDDNSATDRLIVQGNVSGNTVLNINNVGGAGAATTEGIPIIQVDGTSGASAFEWDIGTLRVGNFQYVLQRGSVSGSDQDGWYLVSAIQPMPGSQPPLPLWRPAISGYSVARSMNADMGFMQVGTLHQREGEQIQAVDELAQAWGRILAQDLRAKGQDRFSYDQRASGFQLGADLYRAQAGEGGRSRAGWLAHYVSSRADAWDQLRLQARLETETSRINTQSWGLGGYHTHTEADGAYTNWVGHLVRISNDFLDTYGTVASQTGWQLALGVERGLPLAQFQAFGHGWAVEGQGQLVLLHTRYARFEDGFSSMHADGFSALRGRLGLRLHNRRSAAPVEGDGHARYYLVGSLVQDLLKTDGMTLQAKAGGGRVVARERFDQSYLELGAGAQADLGQNRWLWTDARYELGLKNRKNTGKITLGVKQVF
jgi:outer membrane autotransporter protein